MLFYRNERKREFEMSSNNSTAKTFIFAIVMCVICSFLLTAAAVGLKDRQVKNIELDKQKNILKSLSLLDTSKKVTADEVDKLYSENVRNFYMTASGNLSRTQESESDLPLFVVGVKEIKSYAMPFKAYGLWSWVYGYVAVAGDGNTVVGLTVYQHGETPGLGGEVEKDWFQKQFIGKKLTDSQGKFISVGIVKGKVVDRIPVDKRDNFVDGISGATITSVGMEKYLRIDLSKYEPFSKLLRQGQ
ncbi:NADH:ubiquinone reductase (Na(+)-transporting) subunit C [Candidatus Marinamargulisbacteria bacterium SCGC AAA071-K20]|nr:NADH:ubiquinone reductase (Na(+)-transporting) subunit C [Candidatus Marinamargulisbacteria bacterium SCGC AAA071-K20]